MKEDEAIVYVESVTDYLNALPEGDEFFDTLLDKLVLYRGQGNKNWSLMPGVMRDREDYLNEELYIKECLRQYPEEFKNVLIDLTQQVTISCNSPKYRTASMR